MPAELIYKTFENSHSDYSETARACSYFIMDIPLVLSKPYISPTVFGQENPVTFEKFSDFVFSKSNMITLDIAICHVCIVLLT